MRLLALELNDFQAHKKTVVEFSPAITTIVGPTDVGKSAVLRALRWVCLNDIAGDEFIREGQNRTTVTLSVTEKGFDEHEIVRTKSLTSTGLNTYELDEKEYKAFGVSVPSDIGSLLNLNEINFQGQHDSPFWFNETAGEVSRRLNAVVDLTVIDTTLANIASEVRQAQERKAFTEERLSEAKEDLEKLEPQRARIEEFKLLKEAHGKYIKLEEDCNHLDTSIREFCSLRDYTKGLEEKSNEGTDLLAIAKEGLDLAQRENRLHAVLQSIKVHEAVRTPPDFGPIETVFEEWLKQDQNVAWLTGMVRRITEANTALNLAETNLSAAEKKFHAETKGKQCPLCQQIIVQ